MATILEEIVSYKKDVLSKINKSPISFIDRIKSSKGMAVIAEIKRASPSKGDLNIDLDPRLLAREYEESGASAISVLTEDKYFKGSYKDLLEVRLETSLPILCKDFIVDRVQIDIAYKLGADIILLIAACLDDYELSDLYSYALSYGLNIIIEVHSKEEIHRGLKLNPSIIGINNRNLKTFKTDIRVTGELIKELKGFKGIVISESGIKSNEDIRYLKNLGVDCVLVGESFVTSNSLKDKILEIRDVEND
ncbi:MAG: indole-3-glycerol phosphate synthase TrpC [Clostridium sp.]|uniref:indole-3-glycerol phosphate synthase TrpC n=1 Tax=Clostridium sp. TaxID=1506 RepID=UPI002FC7BF73